MKKRKSYFLILSVTGLLLTACSQTQHQSLNDSNRSESETIESHAIHDAQLREMMDKMDSLMSERFMTETQLDSERRKYAQHIANKAQSLSKTVASIIAKLPTLSLSPRDQSIFLTLASQLNEQSQLLYKQASLNHTDSIDDTLHQLNTTCTTCHALFRKTDEGKR